MTFFPGGGGKISTSSDVALNNPSDRQVLAFDSNLAVWKNANAAKPEDVQELQTQVETLRTTVNDIQQAFSTHHPNTLPAPTLTAQASSTQALLSWTAVTGAVSYQLREGSSVIFTGGANSFTDTNVVAGSSTSYSVVGIDSAGASGLSQTIYVTIPNSGDGSGLPDLVATPIAPPSNLKAGDQHTFQATVTNNGPGAVAQGIIIGIPFYVDNVFTSASDNYSGGIAVGQTITLTANRGPNNDISNPVWTATAGSHQLKTIIDDINRISEADETNNSTTLVFDVQSSTTPPPDTSTPGTVRPSWVAATNVGGGFFDAAAIRLPHAAHSAFIAADGKSYVASNWEERADELGGLNADGTPQGHYKNVHTSPAGYAVTVSGTDVFWGDRAGFRRHSSSTLGAVSLPSNGSGEFGSVRATSGNDHRRVRGLAVIGSEIFVSQDDNRIHVYSLSNYAELRSWATSAPNYNCLTAGNGRLAYLSGSTLTYYSTTGAVQGSITNLTDPIGLALDDQNPGRIGICLGAGDHRVVYYDYNSGTINASTTAPVKTLGVLGGMMSTSGAAKGSAVDKHRFIFPRFARILSDGSYIVVMYAAYPLPDPEAGGVIVRRFNSSNNLAWENLAMIFCDTGFIDPDEPAMLYTVRDKFSVDHSANTTTPGLGWSLLARTLDSTKAGDPRIPDAHAATAPQIRTLNGQKIMATVGMYSDSGLSVYKRNGDTYEYITNLGTGGWGQWLAVDGSYWRARGDRVVRRLFSGFDGNGNPSWGAETTWMKPSGSDWVDIRRAQYDSSTDTLFVSGFTSSQSNPGINDMEKLIGKVIRRYNNFSSSGLSQTATWSLNVPFSYGSPGSNGKVDIRKIYAPMGMYAEGDYIFTADIAYGLIRVYRKSNGSLLQTWNPTGRDPGATQPSTNDSTNPLRFNLAADPGMPGTGVCDIPNCITATRLPDGRYAICVEDNGSPKLIVYYWTPAV